MASNDELPTIEVRSTGDGDASEDLLPPILPRVWRHAAYVSPGTVELLGVRANLSEHARTVMMRDPSGRIPEHPIPFAFAAEARTFWHGVWRWLPWLSSRWF
jgi:hypothetical protein